MSADEDRSHFGLWAILAAPLLTGNGPPLDGATTKAILTNTDVIAVNQDSLGAQATVVATPGNESGSLVQSRSQERIRVAVALFNRSEGGGIHDGQWSAIAFRLALPPCATYWKPEGSWLVHGLLHGNQHPEARRCHAQR